MIVAWRGRADDSDCGATFSVVCLRDGGIDVPIDFAGTCIDSV
jgi:hypothetical protein